MKQCHVCGLMLPDEALRCTMCNAAQNVEFMQEQSEPVGDDGYIDPLEAEMAEFFSEQSGDAPSPFAHK